MADAFGLRDGDLSAMMAAANSKMRAGRSEEALKLYSMLVLMKPRDLRHQMALAECGLLTGNYDLALHCAAAAVSLDPADARGYFLSGCACLGLNLPDEAIADLNDAVQLADAAEDADLLREAKLALSQIQKT